VLAFVSSSSFKCSFFPLLLSLSASFRLISGNFTYSSSEMLTAQVYLTCSQAVESGKSMDLGLISLEFKR